MKNIKKLFVMLFAFVASLFVVTTVYAAPTAGAADKGTSDTVYGKITINNAVKDETYSIYKIFDLESYDKTVTPNTYAYKIASNSPWMDFFTDGAGEDYVDIDEDGYVTVLPGGEFDEATTAENEANAETFAKAALAYAKTKGITPTVTSVTATGSTVTFENLGLGYYLLDTTLGTLCSLTTTNNERVVNEKNVEPTVVNEAKDDETDYVPVTDAAIGEKVKFESTINAYKGAENYVEHVTLGTGLTLDTNSIVVKEGATTLTPGTHYTVVTTGLSNGETFNIVFSQTYLDTIDGVSDDPTEIVVTYDATLNENATIDGYTNNTSAAYLSYDGNTSPATHLTSATDTAKVYTWKTNYYKFYKDNETKKPLANAVFEIKPATTGASAINLISLGTTGDVDVYRVAKPGETGTVSTITTNDEGLFEIQGLDSGKYNLVETEAPQGYNKLTKPIVVTIERATNTDETMTKTIKIGENSNQTTIAAGANIEIENKSGTLLPETGGKGTKALILIGTLIFLSTAVILTTKKRMYNAG